jgi:hypothetical protein
MDCLSSLVNESRPARMVYDFSEQTNTQIRSKNCLSTDWVLDQMKLANVTGLITSFTAAVPEPSNQAMAILGFHGLGSKAYRRKHR